MSVLGLCAVPGIMLDGDVELLAECPSCSLEVRFATPSAERLVRCTKCKQLIILPPKNPLPRMEACADTYPDTLRHAVETDTSEPPKDEDGNPLPSNLLISALTESILTNFPELLANHDPMELSTDSTRSTALHWACSKKSCDYEQWEAIRLLLNDERVRVNYKNANGQTAVMWAAIFGNIQVCQLLAAAGADLHATDNKGLTVIHHAAKHGNVFLIEFFRSRSVPTMKPDSKGRNELHWAAYKNNGRTVRWLLNQPNMDILATDSEGCMAMHWATLQGHKDMVVMLAEHSHAGEQLMAKDTTGLNPHELAMEKSTRVNAQQRPIYLELAHELKNLEGKVQRSAITKKNPHLGMNRDSWFFWALAVVEWVVSYAMFVAFVVQKTSHLTVTIIVFFFSTAWQIWSWYMCSFSDPGYVVEPNRALSKKMPPQFQILKDQYRESVNTCFTAYLPMDETDSVVRPPRAKHDSITDRTVLRFDHFCPWMNNAVGRNNYLYYISFLFATLPISCSWSTLGYTYLSSVSPSDATFLGQCALHPLKAFWFYHYQFYVLYSLLLIYQHGKLILSNMTTNEYVNHWKYPYLKDMNGGFYNPFDQGKLKNLGIFFRRAYETALPPISVRRVPEPQTQ